jgi:tRNA-dihydrouridine synthase B
MIPLSFLAPIDSYTNLPFRMMCQRQGAEASCVPLVSAYTVQRERKKLDAMVDAGPEERHVGVQLVGKDSQAIGAAAREICEAKKPAWLNLNCGCPSVRTVGSGGGSALLGQPEIIVETVERMKASCDSPISVKLRLMKDAETTAGICRKLEKAGVDFLILHGRTPAQGYSGKADWDAIRKVKEALGVPLVGNGDIKCAVEGKQRVEDGFCDAYMIGRAAMGNPLCFRDMEPEGQEGRFELLREYVGYSEKYLGRVVLQDVRLKAINFLAGVPGAARLRNIVAKAKSAGEILELESG